MLICQLPHVLLWNSKFKEVSISPPLLFFVSNSFKTIKMCTESKYFLLRTQYLQFHIIKSQKKNKTIITVFYIIQETHLTTKNPKRKKESLARQQKITSHKYQIHRSLNVYSFLFFLCKTDNSILNFHVGFPDTKRQC